MLEATINNITARMNPGAHRSMCPRSQAIPVDFFAAPRV
jgi:hypothetical protein